MNYLVTITDKNFQLCTQRLILSARDAGYRGEIVVLTPDDNIYCNETVIKLERKFQSKTKSLNDSRWLQFSLLEPEMFKDGDKILYLDSDCIIHKDFPFDEIFDYTFATSVVYHDDFGDEINLLRNLLEDDTINKKYIASPFVFEINKQTRKFFKLCKIFQHIANECGRGTLYTFNLACYSSSLNIEIIPKEKCIYTKDIVEGKTFSKPYITHYGGGKGKELWKKEYYRNLPVSYIKTDKKAEASSNRNLQLPEKGGRIAFQTTEGLGNQIQTYLVYRVLVEKFKDVDVIFSYSDKDSAGNSKFYEVVTKHFGNHCFHAKNGNLDPEVRELYKELFTCRTVKVGGIPLAMQNPNFKHGSEFDRDNEILGYFGISKNDIPALVEKYLPIDWKKMRGNDFKETAVNPEVLICCGSKYNLKWMKKRYLRMNEVVERLRSEYEVVCVGLPDEYIPGCVDATGIGLERTLDIASQAKTAITNDGGLYHFLNLCGIDNIPIFGSTSMVKNSNRLMHSKAKIASVGCCEKQPCQSDNWNLKGCWDSCTSYECMKFDPDVILGLFKEIELDNMMEKA